MINSTVMNKKVSFYERNKSECAGHCAWRVCWSQRQSTGSALLPGVREHSLQQSLELYISEIELAKSRS